MAKSNKSIFSFPPFLRKTGAIELSLFLLVFFVYGNTLFHDFTQDDAIVIYDNIYVQEGFSGIGKIFTTDSFSGFFKGEDKSGLVSGGRYRPMTIMVFAMVYELVESNPFYYHLLNILFYSILCILMYRIIVYLDYGWKLPKKRVFAFMTVAIFIVHPIHTEVVANVKGLDEIFSLLFSLLTLFFSAQFVKSGNIRAGVLVSISFLIALLSKENAVAILGIIPITLYFLQKTISLKKAFRVFGILVFTFVGYWYLRTSMVGFDLGQPSSEMMNNPFIKVMEDGQYLPFTTGEKSASIVYGLGKYIQLLFFPHPLTHDYYPRHFGVISFENMSVIASLVMNVTALLIGILGIRKRSFISFCIFLFYASIGLMSNIIFPIGTHLSERFLFTPSLAFALLLAYVFIHFFKKASMRQGLSVSFILLLSLFSIKTMARNNAWKNDVTLFTTDVKTSSNSAKIRNAAGGALLTESLKLENSDAKETMIRNAIEHLKEAIRIHPRYKEAHLLLGNGMSYIKDYEQSITAYENALKLDPYYDLASSNLQIVLREGAREAGANRRDYATAIKYLTRVLELDPNDAEAVSLMGTAYGSSGDHKNAILFYERAIDLNPDVAITYVNLGFAQLNMGLEDDAQINFNKAVQIDPKVMDNIQNND